MVSYEAQNFKNFDRIQFVDFYFYLWAFSVHSSFLTWVRLIYGNSICFVYDYITEAFITLFARWLCLLLSEAFTDLLWIS